MRFLRKKDGFTLIELLIVILTGTIVTAAATTILLLAMRINRKSLDTIERQSIMRIMQSVFEDLGSDGSYEFTDDAIKVKGSQDDYVIRYDETNDQLITGQGGILMEDVTSFNLEEAATNYDGLYTFSIESQGENYISSVYGRTQDDDWFANDPALDYESGRNLLVDIAASQIGSTGKIIEELNRYYTEWYIDEYININGVNRVEFNQAATDKESWNPSTPWCATFVSWALNQCEYVDIDTVDGVHYLYGLPQDASVNYLWMENFVLTDQYHMKANDASAGTYHTPQPGDLIFFEYYDPYPENPNDEDYEPEDNPEAPLAERQNLNGLKFLENDQREALNLAMWRERNGYYINVNPDSGNYKEIIDSNEYAVRELLMPNMADYVEYDVMEHYLGCVGDGLDHVGIVVKVEYEVIEGVKKPVYVYTIEGNVKKYEANGMATYSVMLRKYAIDDESIFGYATLNWNPAYK